MGERAREVYILGLALPDLDLQMNRSKKIQREPQKSTFEFLFCLWRSRCPRVLRRRSTARGIEYGTTWREGHLCWLESVY